jgi:hypothetical protein
VRVHGIQANRHVSENVEHVGDLQAELALEVGFAYRAGPGQLATLSVWRSSSSRLRAERSQRSSASRK